MLRLTAHVACPRSSRPSRAYGLPRRIAFTDATQETLDDYCRRYGAERPLPSF
jgi:hypothetical protein